MRRDGAGSNCAGCIAACPAAIFRSVSSRSLEESAENLEETARATVKQGFPFKDYPPHPLAFPSWDADPYRDRSWRFRLNAWHFLDPICYCTNVMEIRPTGVSSRHGSRLVRHHIAEQRMHEFAWYDMAVGRRAAMLAKILDAALGDLAAGHFR